jgi:DNA-binding MarR family transcriptional regulator
VTLSSPLTAALHRYVEARTAALVLARQELGVNELDARAVLYIAAHAGTRAGDLRAYLGITAAGVTTLIDRLVERAAVRRDVDAEDRRVIRLTLVADLAAKPWSALTRFDDAFTTAVTDADLPDAARFATALDGFTESAVRSAA